MEAAFSGIPFSFLSKTIGFREIKLKQCGKTDTRIDSVALLNIESSSFREHLRTNGGVDEEEIPSPIFSIAFKSIQ
jgi:hypothetical protein